MLQEAGLLDLKLLYGGTVIVNLLAYYIVVTYMEENCNFILTFMSYSAMMKELLLKLLRNLLVVLPETV